MNEALTLTFAGAVPFLCLGLVLWLARLEETLSDGLEPAPATPEPATAAVPPAAEVPGAPATAPAGAAA